MRRQPSRSLAIDSARASRFAADWAAIWPEDGPVGLAVSGGPDSLALLLLAQAVLPGRFRVATVDHGLRRESNTEAGRVAVLCASCAIPHSTLRLDLVSGPALQERARVARYAALGDWADSHGLTGLVTAHHADDQAETLIMRLHRSAGLRGLAAMRARSAVPAWPDLALLRPLLGWRKSELASIVDDAGVEPVTDPSNADLRFERARIREGLGRIPDFDPVAVGTSVHHLAEADLAIEWATDRIFANVLVREGGFCWSPGDIPRVIALRVLERIVATLGSSNPRGSAFARWYDRLSAGEVATLAGVRGDGRSAEWQFVAAPAPRLRF